MSIRLYMDVHVRRAVTNGLRLRGIDVLTAQQDSARTFSDPKLLDRATGLGRALFTQDEDLLNEASKRQRTGDFFCGVIYAHQENVTVSTCIDDQELISKVYEPEDLFNRVEYLPLK
jgi:hypothetical protein